MPENCTYTIRLDEEWELEAMRVCTEVLDPLDESAKRRVIRWLAEYHGVYVVALAAPSPDPTLSEAGGLQSEGKGEEAP